MNDWIIYLIKVNLSLLFLYGFYLLFLKKETSFNLNRAYLLMGLLVALSVPLLQISLPEKAEPVAFNHLNWKAIAYSTQRQAKVSQKTAAPLLVKTVMVPSTIKEKVITLPVANKPAKILSTTKSPESLPAPTNNTQKVQRSFTWLQWGLGLYLLGVAIGTLLLAYHLGKILLVIFRANIMKQKGYKVIYTYGKLPMLSFFNYLFWDNTLKLTSEQKQQIIIHETAHIRHWHTLDVLLIELFCVLFWYNPVVYWWRSALRENHEFVADKAVIKQQDAHSYAMLLLSQGLGSLPQFTLGNRLVQSQIKKRVNMMTKKTMNYKIFWKYVLLIPMLACLGIGFGQISYGQSPALAASSLLTHQLTSYNIAQSQKLATTPQSSKITDQQQETAQALINEAIKRKIYQELELLTPVVLDSPITDKEKRENKMRRLNTRRGGSVYINGNRDRHYYQMDSGHGYVYLEARIKGTDYEVRYDKKGNVKRLYVDGKKIKERNFRKHKKVTRSMWKDWVAVKEGLKDLSVSLKGLGKDLRRSMRSLNRGLSINLDGFSIAPFVNLGLDISTDVLRNLKYDLKDLKRDLKYDLKHDLKDLKRDLKHDLDFSDLFDALKELKNIRINIDDDDDDD